MFCSLRFAGTIALACLVLIVPGYARPQSEHSSLKRPAKNLTNVVPPFHDVQFDSPYYNDISELERAGFMKLPAADQYRRPRTRLTRYEFAVYTERTIDVMIVRTLARHGRQLESVFGIPNNLEAVHAIEMLDLWKGFQPELFALGVTRSFHNHVRQTLEVYIHSTPLPPIVRPVQ